MANEIYPDDDAASTVSRPPMRLATKLLIGLCCIAIIAVIALMTLAGSDVAEVPQEIRADQVGGMGRPFVPAPGSTPPPPNQTATNVVARPGSAPAPKDGMLSSILPQMPAMGQPRPAVKMKHFQAETRTDAPSQTGTGGPGGTADVSMSGRNGDSLDSKLQSGDSPTTVTASVLPDPHLFLTVGTGLPCIFEQPINTDVPGPFNCVIRGNVMGHSGAVSLLDDGTRIFGRIVENVGRGKRRTFGVVTRVTTPANPQSCIINLRAPVGDQLGTPGLDGEIDTHFFERFRGHALLALFDIASQTAAIAASRAIGGDSGVSFNQIEMGARDLGEGTVGDDINIPPTLKRAHAQRALITVMDDIDMRGCYKLRRVK